MKLNSDGVTISILILITMILICHTMNYLYPKNKFTNIPQTTNYNEIYYSNKNTKLCSNINTGGDISSNMLSQANVPYDVISTCSDNICSGCNGVATATTFANATSNTSATTATTATVSAGGDDIKKYLATLSDSELAVLYKVAYESTEREIITRTLNDLSPKTTKPN